MSGQDNCFSMINICLMMKTCEVESKTFTLLSKFYRSLNRDHCLEGLQNYNGTLLNFFLKGFLLSKTIKQALVKELVSFCFP